MPGKFVWLYCDFIVLVFHFLFILVEELDRFISIIFGSISLFLQIPQFLTSILYNQLTSLPKLTLYRHITSSSVQLCKNPSNQSEKSSSYGSAATRLRFPVRAKAYRLRNSEGTGGGVTGRMMLLRRYVSRLLDDERLELVWSHAVEARLYTERLIQEGVMASTQQDLISLFEYWKNSDETENKMKTNIGILELAVFWLTEERLVEKFFKVLVPRYRFYERAYTSLFKIQAPVYPVKGNGGYAFGILELHGNPWPPVRGHGISGRDLCAEPFKNRYLINVLLDAARKATVQQNTAKLLTTPPSSSSSSSPYDNEVHPINS
ncbi:unnamed protein product [Heterobilharzia americana]|nr:unnamed protein product [Heterobilharzia americana]